jgi:4-hydroxy-3-polyprenylbenzoate decarboxylase
MSERSKRLVVGITGASGAILGIRLLEVLNDTDIETHLVVSPAGRATIRQETDRNIKDVIALATQNYKFNDIGASIASGSFRTLGMVVIPCSIKTLSAIANSYDDDLIARAADVTLKEGRPLLLVVRETPLHRGHIHLMDKAARSGAIIFPPLPAFYTHPQSIDDIVDNIVGRVLLRLGIDNDKYQKWDGMSGNDRA